MSQATKTEVSEHPAIRCLFELRYDGTVSVVFTSGCSDLDVHEIFTLFAAAEWRTDQLRKPEYQSSEC